jgi:phosphoserine phosphatase RsbU/P
MTTSGTKSILVIDDDLTIRKVIGHHLRKNDYNSIEVENASQAFNILGKENIDLVLCDVTMDEMDGFEFCRKVRENENHRFLPFVFVTAKSSLEDKSKAMEVGGDDIITKPFDVDELLIKVKALLRRSEIYKVYGVKKQLESAFTERPAKILFVDDDPSISKLFKYNLEKAGFECTIASNVDEALESIKSIIPDIIVSDIMMPKTDGFQFRRILLNDNDLKDIPFIFLTAKGEENDILDGYDLGITDYVLKTAGPKIVVAKVTAVIKSLGNERKKIVSELHQAASSLRAKVVPDDIPVLEGFNIQQWHIPYKGIPGGDFIDYFYLDNNNLAIILGDVMGKKWGAWYFAFAYAGYVRTSLRGVLQNADEFSPSAILNRVNKAVYNDSKISEVFTTLSILIINNKEQILRYAGAGDVPLLLKNSKTGDVSQIQSKGFLLGFVPEGNYQDIVIGMNPGDMLLLLTDGILETRNNYGEMFGEERLLQLISETPSEEKFLENIQSKIRSFSNDMFEDDISLIAIKKL